MINFGGDDQRWAMINCKNSNFGIVRCELGDFAICNLIAKVAKSSARGASC